MDHEPGSPPAVTITDPNRPGEQLDVLGSGTDRDPWRPGRRTWSLVGVLVLVAAVVIPIDLVRQHDAAERAKDKTALAQAHLTSTTEGLDLSVNDRTPEAIVPVGIRNDGTLPLTLRSFQVMGPGYQKVTLKRELLPYAIVTLSVPDTQTCGPAVLTPPATLRLELTTSRDQRITRDVKLFSSGGGEIAQAAQTRCRFLSPAQALDVRTQDVQRRGRTLAVTVTVANAGRLPLTLTDVRPDIGLRLVSALRLPVPLVPEPQVDKAREGYRLTVTLSINCDIARSDEVLSSMVFPAHLSLLALRGEETGQQDIEVLSFEDGLSYVQSVC